MKKILFVCKANVERSATAEAFAKKYIKEHNLPIEVSSAGVYVDHIAKIMGEKDIHDNLLPNCLKIFILELALQNNIFSNEQEKQLRYLLNGNFNQVEINRLYIFAKKVATARMEHFYLPLLKKLEIKYPLHEQVVPRNYDYVIPMLEDEKIEVEKAFWGTGLKPKIVLFHEFIGIEEECPIAVTANGIETYQKLYQYMKKHVPILLDKILKHNL